LILLSSTAFGQVTRTWNGGGGDSFWTNRLNWGGTAPLSGNLLLFEGTSGLSPLNTFTSGTVFNGLSFGSTAGAFTLSGYPFGLFGNISNNSAQNQVINNNITLSKNDTLSSSGGDITLNGVISGAFSVTKTGSGLVRLGGQNRFSTRITISDGTLELAGGDSTLAGKQRECCSNKSRYVYGYSLSKQWMYRYGEHHDHAGCKPGGIYSAAFPDFAKDRSGHCTSGV